MKIHQYARQGDIAGVRRELAQHVSIEAIEGNAESLAPRTPLQCAIASPKSDVNIVEFLIAQGAKLSLRPQSGKSDLSWAIHSGQIEKVQLLLDLGADLGYVDEHGYDALLDALFSAAAGTAKIALVQFLIDEGCPLNGRSSYGESGLSVASRSGWFDLVQVLLDAGCDRSLLGWTDLMQAIALGSLSEVNLRLQQGGDLTAVDAWDRTPWLLSVHVGVIAKAKLLLDAGASPLAVGRRRKPPLMYALESGHPAMLGWLLELGLDVNATDELGETALMLAAELDQIEAASMLLAAGAIVRQTSYNGAAIKKVRSLEMVELLLAAGENLFEFDDSVRRRFTKVSHPGKWTLDCASYQRDKYLRFGDRNPTAIESPYWREMVKFRSCAYAARCHYQDAENYSDGAVWCFQRFGQSITVLPDGRVIEIAGEHEAYYDPDFCIYNDVVIYDGQGDFQIYGYPRAVFPPTDFHTATWVEGWIYIIGNLGYGKDRITGETPVYRLNCTTFAIEKVSTQGESPGWMSNHQAVLHDRQITISGGQVWGCQSDQSQLTDNHTQYRLDLNQGCWHRVDAAM